MSVVVSMRNGARCTDEIRHLDDPNAMRLHETSSGVHLVLPTNYGYGSMPGAQHGRQTYAKPSPLCGPWTAMPTARRRWA